MKLQMINYTKSIKKKTILDNININLSSGNIYGFYGRNGSGKTMLFRALCTLIFPDSGDVLIDDVSIINDDYDLRNFGVLLENPSFYPYLSGFDNLKLLYEINNKKNDEYINKILNEIGLEDVKNKKFKEYSLGMKQKLRIAQAYMENQKIIILDEPTNGLDEKSVENIRKIINNLKKQNKIILIASHNKDDLRILCNKIFKIEEGKIIGEIKL